MPNTWNVFVRTDSVPENCAAVLSVKLPLWNVIYLLHSSSSSSKRGQPFVFLLQLFSSFPVRLLHFFATETERQKSFTTQNFPLFHGLSLLSNLMKSNTFYASCKNYFAFQLVLQMRFCRLSVLKEILLECLMSYWKHQALGKCRVCFPAFCTASGKEN